MFYSQEFCLVDICSYSILFTWLSGGSRCVCYILFFVVFHCSSMRILKMTFGLRMPNGLLLMISGVWTCWFKYELRGGARLLKFSKVLPTGLTCQYMVPMLLPTCLAKRTTIPKNEE